MDVSEIKDAELIWPGKYNKDGKITNFENIVLPFQIIETINKSRAEREKRKKIGKSIYDYFDQSSAKVTENNWRNKLIWGDNKLVMSSLLKNYSKSIDLIYIDPPFATGADFSYKVQIGEEKNYMNKEQSIIEKKAYRDTWGAGFNSYLQMIYDRLMLSRDLLADNGTIYVHLDWRIGFHVKILMDSIFGYGGGKNKPGYRNDIIWCYTGPSSAKDDFPRKHDMILRYSKGTNWTFNQQRIPYKSGVHDTKGTALGYKGKSINVDEIGKRGKLIEDWWTDIWAAERYRSELLDYETQKPEALLTRIIEASSNEGDLVADFFCGSGTTCSVAEKLGRKWIGCDLSRWAIHVTRKRLLEIEECKPFEILNLGKYERQYWQDTSFGKEKDKMEDTIFQYVAFILKLYEAEPISGTKFIHGKKENAMIHVGSVDSPVTIDEINLCIDECLALKQGDLHILGWEWEMGLYELMIKEAKSKGINLTLLNIPREVMDPQAVKSGNINFFELAYMNAKIEKLENKKIKIVLNEFAMPNSNLIPDDIQEKVSGWSDYIDYWAVDWDFQNDTFVNGWVAYRTKKDRKLPLESDAHKYKESGKYTIFVKVVDIFGNDTSVPYEIEVE